MDKQSFIELINELYTDNRESALTKLINEFKNQIELINLLIKECNLNSVDEFKNLEFVKILINLPQLTSNIFQLVNDPLFRPEFYFNNLCSIIFKSLKEVYNQLKEGYNQNLSLITQLIGQICFNKFDQIYWSKIGERIHNLAKNDLIWRKIGRRLIKQQNTLYIESLIRLLLLNADNYEQIEWYLGSELNNFETKNDHQSTIKYLLTNKFLLINHFPLNNHRLIDNIIGYLIHFNLKLFEQTLFNLISIWSNATLVRHQTENQHYYLCRILICSLKYMIKLEFKLDVNQFQSLILHSAETHLKMVELKKRNCGLFVVERLINYLNKDKLDDRLDFEIQMNDEIRFLIEILEEKIDLKVKDELSNQNQQQNEQDIYDYENVNDEDDDLVPYDLSNDTPLTKTKKPIYLKDCLEGLMNNEDLEYNSTCMQYLSELIDKNKTQATELAIDFIRVLLFLDNEDEELKDYRKKSMIKLCNLNPINSAQYLTKQIYDQNLSITRKLEILDLIVESARELSNLKNQKSIEDDEKVKSIQNIVRPKRKPNYEKIIEERLKAKTKIFCSTQKLSLSYKNEFVQYVNHYFYPLINNFDKKDVTLKFNEDDYFVLGRLMITLAELIKSVSQSHLTGKMSIALIDFLNVFKNHPESYVRKSISICIHSILTNVSNYFLFEELQSELLSFRDFLLNLKQLDPETFHSHGVLTLYTLQEQLNDYQNQIKLNEKMKKNQLTIKSQSKI